MSVYPMTAATMNGMLTDYVPPQGSYLPRWAHQKQPCDVNSSLFLHNAQQVAQILKEATGRSFAAGVWSPTLVAELVRQLQKPVPVQAVSAPKPLLTDAEQLAHSQLEAIEIAKLKGRMPSIPSTPPNNPAMPAAALRQQHANVGVFLPEAFRG